MKKKIDYVTLITFVGCFVGSVKYLLLYINGKQTIDLVVFIIFVTVFLAFPISLLLVKIIKSRKNDE